METLKTLQHLGKLLGVATTRHHVGVALEAVGKTLGFNHVIALDVENLSDRVSPAIVFATAGTRALGMWDTKRPFGSHPVVTRAQRTGMPFSFFDDDASAGAAPGDRSPDGHFGDNGRRNLLVAPAHDAGRLVWLSLFGGAAGELGDAGMLLLGAASHAANERYRRIENDLPVKVTDGDSLSAREQSCVDFMAEGMSDREIAKVLAISPRTVRFHITNAKQKLGVTTRTQAVALRVRNRA